MPRTKNPFRRRTPSETNSRADVIRVLIDCSGQALEIVTHTQIDCQLAGDGPMTLHESAETRHGEIHSRIPERLPKLIRISREEIAERAKEIYAIEAIRYVRPQADAIHSSADLPKVFAPRARVRIAGLIVIFAALAV